MKKWNYAKKRGFRRDVALIPGYLAVGFWVLFTAALIIWILCASLSTTREIFGGSVFQFGTGAHWENYAKAWSDNKVSVYFLNSVLYSGLGCLLVIVISAPAAYALSRFYFRANTFLQKMFVAGMSIPSIMIIMPLFSIVSSLKLTNSRVMLIFLYTCMCVPFTVFFLFTFFKNLSTSFEEAAEVDGCSPVGAFWKIMLPLAQPGIITATIFNFITLWNEYFMALIFAYKTDVRPVAVGLYSMIQSMRYTGDWGGMFAAVVIVFLPTFILYIFLSEKIIAGVTGGGVKQ